MTSVQLMKRETAINDKIKTIDAEVRVLLLCAFFPILYQLSLISQHRKQELEGSGPAHITALIYVPLQKCFKWETEP